MLIKMGRGVIAQCIKGRKREQKTDHDSVGQYQRIRFIFVNVERVASLQNGARELN